MGDLERNIIARIRDHVIFREDDSPDSVSFQFYMTMAQAEKELDRIRKDAFEAGYSQGHNDTVENCARDMHDASTDYIGYIEKPSMSMGIIDLEIKEIKIMLGNLNKQLCEASNCSQWWTEPICSSLDRLRGRVLAISQTGSIYYGA